MSSPGSRRLHANVIFAFASWPYSTILERDWHQLKGTEGILREKEVVNEECRDGKVSELGPKSIWLFLNKLVAFVTRFPGELFLL